MNNTCIFIYNSELAFNLNANLVTNYIRVFQLKIWGHGLKSQKTISRKELTTAQNTVVFPIAYRGKRSDNKRVWGEITK